MMNERLSNTNTKNVVDRRSAFRCKQAMTMTRQVQQKQGGMNDREDIADV
jgi:hypothetical protein